MEIYFIYHISSRESCNKIVSDTVPERFLKTTEDDKQGVCIRKCSEPAITASNVYFVFFSKASMLCECFLDYLYKLYSEQEKTRSFVIQPVRLDDTSLPLFIIRSNIISATVQEVRDVISRSIESKCEMSYGQTANIITENLKQNQDAAIKDLQKSYSKGEIILYCGAGTSFNSNIPTWKELLYNIFVDIYSTEDLLNIDLNAFYETIDKYCGISLPILARYLKNELGGSFEENVTKQLYKKINYDGNELVAAITELCKPKFDQGRIKSIITTNFDDVLERNFEKERISTISIYNDSQQPGNLFPIYHVHGYLPNDAQATKSELVFSEDIYHDQFYLPYKWQNLVQLDAFNHNSCLFIGISFTDPNLRRLLDISRSQCKSTKQHYLIRRIEQVNKLSSISGFSESDTETFIQALNRFQENDAKKLGLNYILVNNYSEIPQILRQIIQD